MATSFDVIYDSFLMKISDYTFLDYTDDELEDDFLKYLRSACVNFRQCEKDLFRNWNDTDKQFNVDLDFYEVEILTILMVIEYLTPHIVATENLKQLIGNREFSKANFLNELTKVRKMFRLEATQLISEYTYARGLERLE